MDTQAKYVVGDLNDRGNPDSEIQPTVVFTGVLDKAEGQFDNDVTSAKTGRFKWVKLRAGGPGGEILKQWP